MTSSSPTQHDSDPEDNVSQSLKEKVSKKAIGVPNPPTGTFRNTSQKRYLQNLEKVEYIVDELQERFNFKIKGWDRNILAEMAWSHIDRRNGFIAPTIKLLLERLEKKEIRVQGKMISIYNLRKKIKLMYKKGIIIRLSDKDGHGDQYVLANMQDLDIKKDNKKPHIREKDSSSDRPLLNDTIIEESLYKIIAPRCSKDGNDSVVIYKVNYPEPEFHHITLLSYLESPEEDYETLEESKDWTMPSEKNRGLKYEGRISRNRTFTIMVYPVGTVEIMIRCTKDPFRWFPREDWIVLYDICNSIHNLLKDYLERGVSSNPLVDSTYLDWQVTQLHLGYDLSVGKDNKATYKEKKKDKRRLNLTKLSIPVRVRNLDGISCQIYVKHMPHKGITLRLEEHINFSVKNIDFNSYDEGSTSLPTPTLKSLKNTITPKSVESIFDNVYSR
jgi:hypothetical protein